MNKTALTILLISGLYSPVLLQPDAKQVLSWKLLT